jgi:integrase
MPSTGCRRERSAGTTLKRDAIRQADIINAQLLNQKYGIADGAIAVDSLFDKFIQAKDGRVKIKTLDRLKTTITSFKTWLADHHPDLRLAKHLTPEVIREFQSYRKDSGLSLRSVNNDIMNLHTVFRWAVREYLVARSPADYSKNGTVDRYKVPRFDPAVYSDTEVSALISGAETRDSSLTRDLIVVFAGTGMRFEELAHLKSTNIFWNLPIPEIEVRAQADWSPKDPYEIKRIPMLPEVEQVFRRRCSECRSKDEYIFRNQLGRKVDVNRSRRSLQSLFPKVGINEDRRLHWHSFRNYFVVRCIKKGIAVTAIMRWLGHDSASMVLHYASAMNHEDAQTEFRKLTANGGKLGERDLQAVTNP